MDYRDECAISFSNRQSTGPTWSQSQSDSLVMRWMRRVVFVRTTLNIDDDVLAAAKAIARRERRTVGDVVSDLARQTLSASAKTTNSSGIFLGFRPLPSSGHPVINEVVNALSNELAI